MKKGDQCTVSHHYGHTDTKKVMTILKIEPRELCKSGIAVWVDGLPRYVDKGLINVIEGKKGNKSLEINIQVPGTTLTQMRKICDRFELSCKKKSAEVYTVSGNDPMAFYWLGANLAEKLKYTNGRKLHEIIEK